MSYIQNWWLYVCKRCSRLWLTLLLCQTFYLHILVTISWFLENLKTESCLMFGIVTLSWWHFPVSLLTSHCIHICTDGKWTVQQVKLPKLVLGTFTYAWKAPITFVMSIHLSLGLPPLLWLPLGRFVWNLIVRTSMKICQDVPTSVTIGHSYQALYMET